MANIEHIKVNEIVKLHNEIGGLLKTSLGKAMRIGELLTEQKSFLNHGEFTGWIKVNLPFTDRTARNYMRLYDKRELLKTETVSDLTGAYKLLGPAKPEPEPEPEGLLKQVQGLAEQKLMTEREGGNAMHDMNTILTPAKDCSIVGTADEKIVFHIERKREGFILDVFDISKKGKSINKQFAIKDKDFWWNLNEHVGIHKIKAIWDEADIMITDEESNRIDEAVKNNSGEMLLGIIDQIVKEHNKEDLDCKGFMKAARAKFQELMSAYGRLYDAYTKVYGVAKNN